MSTPRLQHQFIRLWQHHQGQETDTTLQEIADILHCSRRHVRSLLSSMQTAGWLSWQAETGRGKRSRLCFLQSGRDLQHARAELLIEQDNIEKLVAMVNDKDAMRQMVLSQLERSFRQGKSLLRIVYYRPFYNLLPGSPLRRSEVHLLSQIFNGLTAINEENGEAVPALAHHWQQTGDKQWRFWLRPAIFFHHGRELQMVDIISSFERLRDTHPLFSHIRTVRSDMPYIIDITLNEADSWFPVLTGSPHAAILPHEWQELPDFARRPVGTGPYQVICNNDRKLTIRAFDHYYGFRALLDEVSVLVVPELEEKMVCTTLHIGADGPERDSLDSRMEEGCYFLLHDTRSAKGEREDIRRWLNSLMTPVNLLYHCEPLYQRHWWPAYGLLLRWHHSKLIPPCEKPADLTELTLTYYQDHHEYHAIGKLLQQLLAEQGVKLTINITDYDSWFNGDCDSDFWLATANFYKPLDFSVFATLYELPLLRRCLGDDLRAPLKQWRQRSLSLAAWCEQIIDRQMLFPLFHHWLELQGQRSMRGVKMNTFGWFDFKSAWFIPPES